MAKSFLDTLDDGYEDQFLSDLIPGRTAKKPERASRSRMSEKPTNSSKKTSRSRKKSFLRSIEENIGESTPKRSKPVTAQKKAKRKSFLETIEEAYEDAAFDDLIPDRKWTKKERTDFNTDHDFERKFGTLVTPVVLKRVKEIASSKGVRVQDVIQRALERYLQQES